MDTAKWTRTGYRERTRPRHADFKRPLRVGTKRYVKARPGHVDFKMPPLLHSEDGDEVRLSILSTFS